MNAVDVIVTKRDGGRLTEQEIRWFVQAYTDGAIADEQAAALLMAVFLHGMSDDELNIWTDAMIESGERTDLSFLKKPTVDKHSTGGVGDKVSLILAPLVAACGGVDPMLSGRGLGHTGGTLDKLEAIPGFTVALDPAEWQKVLQEVGCVMLAAGEELAPADRKMYALRDVTGTVESIPLIASSIMSKKIASGTDHLVLDVKIGDGAFLPDITLARQLAETMVTLGESHGVKTSALITDMDQPLGRTAGNGLEVIEAVETLQGNGPSDLVEITIALVEEMLDIAGIENDPRAVLSSGQAFEKWKQMVAGQHGDPDAEIALARHKAVVRAQASGYLQKLPARAIGVAAWRLGAGRSRKEDPVSSTAGVVCLKKVGDEISVGEPLLELHADDPALFDGARAAIGNSIVVGPEPLEPRPLIVERIRA